MLGVKILEEKESKYNGHIKVARSWGLGTYIQAEGLTQSGGIVGTIWQPTIKKVFNSKSGVKNALILGLGGGTTAKYIRLFWPDAKITGIDIDPIMIELGKKYLELGKWGVDIKIGDALKEIQKSKIKRQKYDLVIVDLYNGDKYPEKFETPKFLQNVKNLLSKGGTVVFNRLYYGEKRPAAVKFGKKLEKVFSEVVWYYPEANLMFVCTI